MHAVHKTTMIHYVPVNAQTPLDMFPSSFPHRRGRCHGFVSDTTYYPDE